MPPVPQSDIHVVTIVTNGVKVKMVIYGDPAKLVSDQTGKN